MKKILSLGLLITLFISCTSVERFNAHIDREIPVKRLQKDVDFVYKKLKKNHPKLDLYLPQETIDFKFDSVKKSISKPLKPNEFYKKIQPVVGALRHGHTDISPLFKRRTKKEIEQFKNSIGPLSQLSVFWQNDSLFVLKSTNNDPEIKPGSVILKIDSIAPNELIEKYRTTFFGDGYNATYFENRLNRNFINYFYTLDKSVRDSILFTFSYQGEVYNKIIKRIYKENKSEEKQEKPETPKVKVPKKSSDQQKIKKFEFSYNKSSKSFMRTLSLPTNDSTFAVLKVSTFSYGDFGEDYQKIFKIINEHKVKNLVLDLRNNGGGRLADSYQLFSYLVPKQSKFLGEQEIVSSGAFRRAIVDVFPKYVRPFAYPISLISYFITSKNGENQSYIKPQLSRIKKSDPQNIYYGNLYVLINGGSYSASALIASNLKGFNRAYFVGEETGGDANGSVAGLMPNYELPNSHLKLSIGTVYLQPNFYHSDVLGQGICPHKEIRTTLNDRLKNIDPQLNWVIEEVKNGNPELNKALK